MNRLLIAASALCGAMALSSAALAQSSPQPPSGTASEMAQGASAAQPMGQSSTSMPAASSPERAASGARQSSGAGMSGTNAGTMGSGRADTRSSTSSPGMRAPKADRN